MSLAFARHFIASQFYTLPELDHSFANQTVIVTGANTGLGFECAKHFHHLGASLVILAVRDVRKGEAAKEKLLLQQEDKGNIQVWQLDMSDQASIIAFARKVSKLPRIDVVLENAGMTQPNWQLSKDGHEMTMAVNYYGTILLALLMIPILKESGRKTGLPSRLTIVTSEAHHLTTWGQNNEQLADLDDESKWDGADRYNITKLLEILYVRELAGHIDLKAGPIVNCANPGMCKSEFDRHISKVAQVITRAVQFVLARRTEVGAKTLVWPTTAANASSGHGQYSLDCLFSEQALSRFVRSTAGLELQKRVFAETNTRLDAVVSGVAKAVTQVSNDR